MNVLKDYLWLRSFPRCTEGSEQKWNFLLKGSFSEGDGPRCICLSHHWETNTNIIFTYSTGIYHYYGGVFGCGRKCVKFR